MAWMTATGITAGSQQIAESQHCRGLFYTLWNDNYVNGDNYVCPGGKCQILGNACAASPGRGTGSRTIAEPFLHLLGWEYVRTGASSWKTLGDDLFAAAFGHGAGGPGDDGGAGNFDDATFYGLAGNTIWGKEFGMASGIGYAHAYLAYRSGGLSAPVNRPLSIGFDLSAIPNAASVRITLTRPSGEVVQTECPDSPCSVNLDARQGAHLMKIEYLSAAGAVLAGGEPAMVGVP
jgi:hypothetical protein